MEIYRFVSFMVRTGTAAGQVVYHIVAASRFLPFRGQVRLGEVVLYQPARDEFPTPAPNERIVLFRESCGDPMPASCLFTEYSWRLERAPGVLRPTPGGVAIGVVDRSTVTR